MSKKLFIKTWGCQMNVYDSQKMADVLATLGYAAVETADDADLIVLNGPRAIQAADTKVEVLGKDGQVLGSFAGSKSHVAQGILQVIRRQLIQA